MVQGKSSPEHRGKSKGRLTGVSLLKVLVLELSNKDFIDEIGLLALKNSVIRILLLLLKNICNVISSAFIDLKADFKDKVP